MNLIKLKHIHSPREKERYKTKGVISFLLGDSFKESIRADVSLLLKKQNRSGFPLSGKCSIYIEYYSDRNLSSIGVLKNVLDSLNGLLITDDRLIESALVHHHPQGNDGERISISLISTRKILNIEDAMEIYSPFTQFSILVDTILEDRYQAYPQNDSVIEIEDVNHSIDKSIVQEIRTVYTQPMIEDDIWLSIQLDRLEDVGDIDNFSLQYLRTLEGIMYRSRYQLKRLHLIMNHTSRKSSQSTTISWSCPYYDI